jgi:hypothetical protein
VAVAFGCAEPGRGPSAGGNTNWLVACDEDAECGSETSCLCGRCSLSCSTRQDCAGFPGATCAQSVAAQQQCGAEPVGGVCLLACDADVDCDADLACVQGACVERARASCDDHGDALFCSGFDDQELSEWSLSEPPASTLATTTQYRHAGPSALEARASGPFDRSRFFAEFAPQTSGTLHLRLWMFVEPETVIRKLHLVTLGDVNTPDWGIDLQFQEDALAVETPVLAPSGDGVEIPRGRWFCVRAEITLGDADGAVRAFLDEQPAATRMDIDTLPAAGAHNLALGVDHSAQDEHASIFFDELVLDTSATPCAR